MFSVKKVRTNLFLLKIVRTNFFLDSLNIIPHIFVPSVCSNISDISDNMYIQNEEVEAPSIITSISSEQRRGFCIPSRSGSFLIKLSCAVVITSG